MDEFLSIDLMIWGALLGALGAFPIKRNGARIWVVLYSAVLGAVVATIAESLLDIDAPETFATVSICAFFAPFVVNWFRSQLMKFFRSES